MKDRWNVHEMHNMLVLEETKLKNLGNHFVHYVRSWKESCKETWKG